MTTRALTHAQSARVRHRFQQLWKLHKSQTVAARAIGISQQVFGRILKGDAAGLYVAKKLAKYDRIPVESILDGIPPKLELTIRENPGRWSEATVAAVRKFASIAEDESGRFDQESPEWTRTLDEVERTLDPILRDVLRKRR